MTSASTVLIKDIMTTSVISVSQTCSLEEVYHLLNEHFISGMPVTDGSGNYVGVISKTDLVNPEAISMIQKVDSLDSIKVQDIMNKRELVTVEVLDTVDSALAVMATQYVHRLFVKDHDNNIVGVVSGLDVKKRLRKTVSVNQDVSF